jgi:exopolysaccharide biosynthesis polyprenyl glycosylphosphotransferase
MVASVLFAQFAWVGSTIQGSLVVIPESSELSELDVPYIVLSTVVVVIWVVMLGATESRTPRVLGIGTAEYARVVRVSVQFFASLVVVAFLLKLDIARGYLLTAFAVGLALLLLSRWAWRQWLLKQRSLGRMSARTIVVGNRAGARHIADQFTRRFPHAGYLIIGACYPPNEKTILDGVSTAAAPLGLGSFADVVRVVADHGVDVVIITGGDDLSPSAIRELSWSLEGLDVEMAVSPSLLDVVGPRIHTRSVAGMPLMHIDIPEYEGGKSLLKAFFDRCAAALALIVLTPPMLVIAVMIKSTSRGPVFFLQERIGLRGEPFRMLKFRSMSDNAEVLRSEMRSLNESDQGVLFKIRDDPRVTGVGRFLRRHSLDELPQFINVLKGDMSIVGPRPPLQNEVDQYDAHVLRRFLVRPGLTGPWQVSGRSDLSWDDTVRLDLYYVENWSITTDLIYVWRTVKVMLEGRGAY